MARAISEIADPRLVKALAHPLRVQILEALKNRTASPSELALEFKVPLPNLSYHFRMLVNLELVDLVKTRPRRGAIEHYYRAKPGISIAEKTWGEIPSAVKDHLVAQSVVQVGQKAMAAVGTGGFERGELLTLDVALDKKGWAAFKRAADEFVKAAKAAAAASNGDAASATIAVLAFEDAPPVELPSGPEQITAGDVIAAVHRLTDVGSKATAASVTRALLPDLKKTPKSHARREVQQRLDALVAAEDLRVGDDYRGGATYEAVS